ncbi:hypothetical protein BJX65DRAFT_89624 [Aspergillus insuetus]
MRGQRRRRVVSSCIPCYSKKQKCNRQYPCNQCTRRRRPELCSYVSSAAIDQGSPPTPETRSNLSRSVEQDEEVAERGENVELDGPDNVAERFGYFDYSAVNTLGLLRQFGLDDEPPRSVPASAIFAECQRIPSQPILDFLTQYYIREVNWIGQLLHPPRFLLQYEQWQTAWEPNRSSIPVLDVEFTVLVLRICTFTLHFLPSPTYMVDTIRGIPLSEIRALCAETAGKLANIASRVCTRGSLTRVLHMCFHALVSECEGRLACFWSRLGDCIKVAQAVGLHREADGPSEMDELERELRRRTMWNLIIWDYRLSRSLDRVPFLDLKFCTTSLPRMQLTSSHLGSYLVEPFAERLAEARLVKFSTSLPTSPHSTYDCNVAEERYERFCTGFLPTIPEPFALGHHTQSHWAEEDSTTGTRQRELLHLALYEYILLNFRPLLSMSNSSVQELPKYKQALLRQHRTILARTALGMLHCTTTLHSLLGQCHTRLSLITFHTFEAATVLVCLLLSQTSELIYTTDEGGVGQTCPADPLSSLTPDASPANCLRAVQDAQSLLDVLAQGSPLADVGSRNLARLVGRIKEPDHHYHHHYQQQHRSILWSPSRSTEQNSARLSPSGTVTTADAETQLDMSLEGFGFGSGLGLGLDFAFSETDYNSLPMEGLDFLWQGTALDMQEFDYSGMQLMLT